MCYAHRFNSCVRKPSTWSIHRVSGRWYHAIDIHPPPPYTHSAISVTFQRDATSRPPPAPLPKILVGEDQRKEKQKDIWGAVRTTRSLKCLFCRRTPKESFVLPRGRGRGSCLEKRCGESTMVKAVAGEMWRLNRARPQQGRRR